MDALNERLALHDRQSNDTSRNKLQVASILYELGRRLEEEAICQATYLLEEEAGDSWTAVDFASPLPASPEPSSDGAGSSLSHETLPLYLSEHVPSPRVLTAAQIDAEMEALTQEGQLLLDTSSDTSSIGACLPAEPEATSVLEEVERRLKQRATDESFPPLIRAVAMYQRAVALASHSLAASRLGVLFLEGKASGMERHHGKAARLLKIAARKGDSEAQYRFGMLCVAHCKVESGLKYLKKCSKGKSEFHKQAQDAIVCTDKLVKQQCSCLDDGSCILDSRPVMDFLVESELDNVQKSMSMGSSSDSIGRKKTRSLARLMRRTSSPSSSPRTSLHGSTSQPSLRQSEQ